MTVEIITNYANMILEATRRICQEWGVGFRPHIIAITANATAFAAVMRYSSSNLQTSFLNVEDLLNRVQLR
ncbi:hypothetical protein, partial [Nostoc sp.]|uniref:hypothetical protein n=1 Tax=Nostoc sp. TaxID=1180 RepID=UPI002FFAC192